MGAANDPGVQRAMSSPPSSFLFWVPGLPYSRLLQVLRLTGASFPQWF